MRSSVGKIINISLFGESHGPVVGMTITGFPQGQEIPYSFIEEELLKRKPQKGLSTTRVEEDKVVFLSGVYNNKTTGAPLTFIIENKNVDSSSYKEGMVRPSHADLTAYVKYEGNNDYRGGGHFSGRLTAPIVVLGALCKTLLSAKNIIIGSHIKQVGNVEDDNFNADCLKEQLLELNSSYYPVINARKKEEMQNLIKTTQECGDSIGGKVETVIINVPCGVGEPYFDGLDAYVSHLLFALGGIKGVIFGNEMVTTKLGSEYNDNLKYENDAVKYLSNNNGGVLGGITTGEPIVVTTLIKPTPSIRKPQQSINVKTQENIDLTIGGRHDPCIVHRIRPAIEALIAFALVDLMLLNNTTKWR